jgi:hypothetical protein
MSHVARIALEIKDLCTLKQACARLGFELVEGRKTYKWYGSYMKDYPLPEGFSPEDLGKCDHAIRVPGAAYEVGVVKRNGRYLLLWDFWQDGGLEPRLGKNAGRLKQAYAIARATVEARRKGYQVQEQRTRQGIRLTLTRRG